MMMFITPLKPITVAAASSRPLASSRRTFTSAKGGTAP